MDIAAKGVRQVDETLKKLEASEVRRQPHPRRAPVTPRLLE
ncbi:MAG: hypothetical protein ABWY56_10745 [Propionibacteriaceae bacterium]